MQTAKIFLNGRSQAVRLPKDCRLHGDSVFVKRYQNMVMLIEKDNPWATLLDSLGKFSDDFMAERNQPGNDTHDNL